MLTECTVLLSRTHSHTPCCSHQTMTASPNVVLLFFAGREGSSHLELVDWHHVSISWNLIWTPVPLLHLFFSHPFPFAVEFVALPLLWLLVFSIRLVISTNIQMAERSRLLLTQWPDFDSWSETEESDEDVRRYKFLFRSPSSRVLDLAWPRFCSHLHFSSLLLSEEMLASTALSVFSCCISSPVVREHTRTNAF